MDTGTANAAGADEADASPSSSASAASAASAPTSQPMRWFPLELQAPVRAKGKKTQDRFRERMAARTKLDGMQTLSVPGFSQNLHQCLPINSS